MAERARHCRKCRTALQTDGPDDPRTECRACLWERQSPNPPGRATHNAAGLILETAVAVNDLCRGRTTRGRWLWALNFAGARLAEGASPAEALRATEAVLPPPVVQE